MLTALQVSSPCISRNRSKALRIESQTQLGHAQTRQGTSTEAYIQTFELFGSCIMLVSIIIQPTINTQNGKVFTGFAQIPTDLAPRITKTTTSQTNGKSKCKRPASPATSTGSLRTSIVYGTNGKPCYANALKLTCTHPRNFVPSFVSTTTFFRPYHCLSSTFLQHS